MPSKTVAVVLVIVHCMFFALAGHNIFENSIITIVSAVIGSGVGLGIFFVLQLLSSLTLPQVIGMSVGGLLGALLGTVLGTAATQNIDAPEVTGPLFGCLILSLTICGFVLGSQKSSEFVQKTAPTQDDQRTEAGVLDTSVIIDGRIADICETGFLTMKLIIPQFVLKELQMIADSAESTKRTRGRRGLDILQKIQKQTSVSIHIDSTEYSGTKEVDQQLIMMAKDKGYAILTNDFNLNKVAEVHSITVLNINQLANALKPIVLPGEQMKVQVIREGKESTQGIAYLDDGTMVVVEQGKKYMGKTVDVSVTSVLQTTAGRMIFGVIKHS